MKEYEKLALKSASYRCTTSNENLDKFIAETHSFGFEMGFQKCREMTVHALLQQDHSEEYPEIIEMAASIGEEEV